MLVQISKVSEVNDLSTRDAIKFLHKTRDVVNSWGITGLAHLICCDAILKQIQVKIPSLD